jgi:uncharacterized protein with GYD domain
MTLQVDEVSAVLVSRFPIPTPCITLARGCEAPPQFHKGTPLVLMGFPPRWRSGSSGRADPFKDMAKKCGATVKDVFWTLGEYDVVAVVEAPDDISMTALGLSSGALGNVRTQTLRALPPERWGNRPAACG